MGSREIFNRCFRYRETECPGLHIRGVSLTMLPDDSYRPLRDLAVSKCDLGSAWNPTRILLSHYL